jgi:hypothetical protein
MDNKQSPPDNDESLPRWGETLKKVMSAGLGAAFMTEEHIRSYLADLKLPKDVIQVILQGASKSKDDLMNRIGNETIRLISKVDFVKEASRFVEEHKFKISAEVEIIKKDNSKDPNLIIRS